jgi:ankyrin repeat protein
MLTVRTHTDNTNTTACSEIEQLIAISKECDPIHPAPLKRTLTVTIRKPNKDKLFGYERAAADLGTNFFAGIFKSGELDALRKTIKKTRNVLGTGDERRALIHSFTTRGRTAVVNLLIEKGTDINARDEYGRTPLIIAVISGHEDMVKLLLSRGADHSIRWKDNTPLIEGAMQNHSSIVSLLLKYGAAPEARNKNGHTALQIAAANALNKVVQTLLDAGAEINTRDNNLKTPLMSAALSNKLWMVSLLLVGGADIFAEDKDGDTALILHQNKQAARTLTLKDLEKIRNTPVAQLLKAEMARRNWVAVFGENGRRSSQRTSSK